MGDRPRGPPRDGFGGRDSYRSDRPREGGFGRGGGAPADKAGAPGSYQPQFGQ
jgi:small subunit ribosomal protein S10e